MRILLVDDEESLCQLLAKYLSRLGYEVDTALSAEDALEMFERDPNAYALLLADLSLPGMRGDELMLRVLASAAPVRVLLSSGFAYDLSHVPEQYRDRASFLQKPYLPRQLAERLKSVPGLAPTGAAATE